MVLVEQIANGAANAGEFMQQMVDRFIGPNLNGANGRDFERAANIGNSEFGSSGFKTQFVDDSNQVRHFTGGLWTGSLYGAGVGELGMHSNEDNTVVRGRGIRRSGLGILLTLWPTNGSKADIALNAVSVPLGANLTPTPARRIDLGDRQWRKIPANPGYKGLASAIRSKVCEEFHGSTIKKPLIIFVVFALLLAGCEPSGKREDILSTEQKENASFSVKVTTVRERRFFGQVLAGASYIFEVKNKSELDWRRFMVVNHDDPIPIDKNSIVLINESIGYVFMVKKFVVTTNGGLNWSIRDR